jgi:uncharacterized protein (DUF58 family)
MAAPIAVDGTRPLLDPEQFARLNRLELELRRPVEGGMAGRHRSTLRGSSVEFAEHRLYTPGDDIRRIDWRAWARTDRYMVKHYEAETQLRGYMLLDRSGSMAYRGASAGARSKLEMAEMLAAGLAYLLLKQEDATGFVAFAAGELSTVPLRSGLSHMETITAALRRGQAAGPTPLADSLRLVTERAGRRALVAVFSDLFTDEGETLAALRQLRQRQHHVVVFHVLDRDELEFPFDDPARFTDTEGLPDELVLSPRLYREGYLAAFGAFLERTRGALRAADITYVPVTTDEPFEAPLMRFLKPLGG